MRKQCVCGDPLCLSCGTAQGTLNTAELAVQSELDAILETMLRHAAISEKNTKQVLADFTVCMVALRMVINRRPDLLDSPAYQAMFQPIFRRYMP